MARLAEVTPWRAVAVVDDLPLNHLVPLRAAVVSMAAALPVVAIFPLILDLASAVLTGPTDLVGDVNEVKNIILYSS